MMTLFLLSAEEGRLRAAYAHLESQRYDKAILSFDEYLHDMGPIKRRLEEVHPLACRRLSSSAWEGKGRALQALQKYDEAISAYRQASNIMPSNRSAQKSMKALQREMTVNRLAQSFCDGAAHTAGEVAVKGTVELGKFLFKKL